MAPDLPKDIMGKVNWKSPASKVYWFDRKVDISQLFKDVTLFASEIYPQMRAEAGLDQFSEKRDLSVELEDLGYGKGSILLDGMSIEDIAKVITHPGYRSIDVGKDSGTIVKYSEKADDYGRIIVIGRFNKDKFPYDVTPAISINFWPLTKEHDQSQHILEMELRHVYKDMMK
jgi:hypothetical protein